MSRPSLATWLSCAVVALAHPASGIRPLRAQQIGFVETFALAEDRAKVLQELIPGSEEHFYYHCLHYQNQGQLAEAEAMLQQWSNSVPPTELFQQMRLRQRLLAYATHPAETLEFLRNELHPQLDHAPPQADRAKDLPTTLDPELLNRDRLLNQALAASPNLENVTDAGLVWLLTRELTIDQTRILLQRLTRVDLPGLLGPILRELKAQDSRGWNAFPIHAQLTLAQRQSLAESLPALLENDNFVRQYLWRLHPGDDEPLESGAVKREHLQRLEDFSSTLPPSQNSLKASVLHQRLALDASQEVFDRDRFERYLALPRQRPHYSERFLAAEQRTPLVELNADYSAETRLPPIRDDQPLIREYLEHFFRSEDAIDRFAKWLDRAYLERVLTETKILHGIGPSGPWYARLTPAEQKELRDRVVLRFAGSSARSYQPADSVSLTVDVKNVPKLIVRIYQLNPSNLYRKNGQPVSTDLDLDGLVANGERTLEYSTPADRQHRELIPLPECDGRGAWVVDLLGGGLRSRALIIKGQLRSTQVLTDAGHEFRIHDEAGKPVPTAHLELGTRTFRPDDRGAILVPYAEAEATLPILLADGAIASVELFRHRRENYSLELAALVDSQNLLSGSQGALILRPRLFGNGQVMPIENLEEAQLSVVTTDRDGTRSTQVISAPPLTADSEWLHPFLVPQRLSSVEVTLTGKVLAISRGVREPVAASQTIAVNGTATSTQIVDFYLIQNVDGYRLQVRGRNGEPIARLPVRLEFSLGELQQATGVLLATDSNGQITLGALDQVRFFVTSAAGIPGRVFRLQRNIAQWPAAIFVRDGESLSLPWVYGQSRGPEGVQDWTLLEIRAGQVAAEHNSLVRMTDGRLGIGPFQPGHFVLTNHRDSRVVEVRVARGESHEGFAIGPAQTLELSRKKLAGIEKSEIRGDKLRLRVVDALGSARVHFLATAFVEDPLFASRFRVTQPSLSRRPFAPAVNFYIDALKLDEEYQYILQRQSATQFPGNLLTQPSLLLSPWDTASTVNATIQAKAGDLPASMAPAPMGADADRMGRLSEKQAEADERSRFLEFLGNSAILLANQTPDAEGWVELPLADLKGYQTVTAVLVDGIGLVSQTIALAQSEVTLADLRLAESFPEAQRLSQQERVKRIAAGVATDLGDARTTRVQVYASVADLFRLYHTLLPSAEWEKFRILTRWHQLDLNEKQRVYSELACHELHLFLYKKDRPFFEQVVRPLLSNKHESQLMDRYLLDQDLSRYQDLWQRGRLNTLERILLAERTPAQQAGTRKWLHDYLEANPIEPEQRSQKFLTALAGSALDIGSELNLAGSALNAFGIPARETEDLFESNRFNRQRDLTKDDPFGDPAYQVAAGELGENREAPSYYAPSPAMERAGGAMGGMGGGGMGMGSGGLGMPVEESLDKARQTSRRRSDMRREQFFQSLDSTREWAESQFYRTRIQAQGLDVIPPGPLWQELALHGSLDNFLSTDVHLASNTLSEMLVALAVVDLPLDAPPTQLKIEQGRWMLTSPSPCLAFVETIEEVADQAQGSHVLVGQDLYLNEPDTDGDLQKPVSGQSLVRGIAYRANVVITNPSAATQTISVLTQIPQGALPLEVGKIVDSRSTELEPYSTQQLEYTFYFPQAGEFAHYGVQVTAEAGHVAAAPSQRLRVLDQPAGEDREAWSFIAQWGTPEQVLEFLKTKNLQRVSLPLIAFRMHDRAFFKACLAELESQGIFEESLWAYAIRHDDDTRLAQWLSHQQALIDQLGPILNSPIARVDSADRYDYEHLDYRPLVIARQHQLGPQRTVLNDRLLAQYQRLLQRIAYQPKADDRAKLALTYYLLLQNRIDEALRHFDSIAAEPLSERIQYDYLDAYLDFFRGRYQRAAGIAERYANYDGTRWRDLFAQLRLQVQQREAMLAGTLPPVETGSGTDVSDPVQRMLLDARQAQQGTLASTAPSLDLTLRDGKLLCTYQNIAQLEVRFYWMDIELLFSRNPFVQQDGGAAVAIQPNRVETIELNEERGKREIVIPEDFASRNVLVEVSAGALRQTQIVYSNSMDATVVDAFGRLQVTHGGGQPVEQAYVKVYARHQGGEVRFFKDGYTDLRGQFDYASLSTNDLDSVERFAILVIHPERGALIREVGPPKR